MAEKTPSDIGYEARVDLVRHAVHVGIERLIAKSVEPPTWLALDGADAIGVLVQYLERYVSDEFVWELDAEGRDPADPVIVITGERRQRRG